MIPVSADGQTAVHTVLGFNHAGRIDIALNPDQSEGAWLLRYLQRNHIPYYAFRTAVAHKATGAHIHLGPGSTRLSASTKNVLRLLIIDNYDSFTYNLAHLAASITGEMPAVVRNDEWVFDDRGLRRRPWLRRRPRLRRHRPFRLAPGPIRRSRATLASPPK